MITESNNDVSKEEYIKHRKGSILVKLLEAYPVL